MYEKRFLKFGHHYSYAGYHNIDEQVETYTECAKLIGLPNWKLAHSILDVGSGTGHFYQYLVQVSKLQNIPFRFFQFKYTGIEQCKLVCDASTLKYGERFINCNINSYNEMNDYVVALGFIGHNDDCSETIKKLLSLAKIAVVVQIFLRHDYLKQYHFDEQVELLKKFSIYKIRFLSNSCLFFLDKRDYGIKDSEAV